MRILYLPLFSNKKIGGCSSFNNNKLLVRALVEMDDDVLVYYPYPVGKGFDVSAISYFDDLDRVITIPMSAMTDQLFGVFYLPGEMVKKFRVVDGSEIVDVAVCELQRMSFWAHLVLNEHTKCSGVQIPILNFHQFQASWSSYPAADDAFIVSQVLGAMVGENVWGCRTVADEMLKEARKFFRPSVIDRII